MKFNDHTAVITSAAELNRVPGFDPMKFARQTKDGVCLDLPYKKLWFRMKHPNGKIRVSPLKITERLAIIEASVFFDRQDTEPVSRYIAQRSREEVRQGRYVEEAQSTAVDSALADAGFGLQFAVSASKESPQPVRPATTQKPPVAKTEPSVKEVPAVVPQPPVQVTREESVEERPLEKAETIRPEMPVSEEVEKTSPPTTVTPISLVAAMREQAVQPKTEAPVEEPEVEDIPLYTEDMSVEDICSLMTLDEARAYRVKEGTCSGWTLQQVAERRLASLKFYQNGYSGKDNILRAGAKLIWDSLQAQAS